jgi:carbonic anhydrase
MILGQACNDLFVVRVAGNVLGSECLGSLDYAITNMADSLRVLLVLGHSNCGAVTAAVDAFLEPSAYLTFASSHPLRAIVDRLFVAVRAGHLAMTKIHGSNVETRPGYREALIQVSVALNAAMQASTVQSEFHDRLDRRIRVVYGIYDLTTREVKLPLEPVDGVDIWLAAPPSDDKAFADLGLLLAGSGRVRAMVKTP